MGRLSKRQVYQFMSLLAWVALCLTAFWGDPMQMVLFGGVFGLLGWKAMFRKQPGIPMEIDVKVTGGSGVLVAVLIVALQLGDTPLLLAGLVLLYMVFVLLGRWTNPGCGRANTDAPGLNGGGDR